MSHFSFDQWMSELGCFGILEFSVLFEEDADLENDFVKVFFFGVVM